MGYGRQCKQDTVRWTKREMEYLHVNTANIPEDSMDLQRHFMHLHHSHYAEKSGERCHGRVPWSRFGEHQQSSGYTRRAAAGAMQIHAERWLNSQGAEK